MRPRRSLPPSPAIDPRGGGVESHRRHSCQIVQIPAASPAETALRGRERGRRCKTVVGDAASVLADAWSAAADASSAAADASSATADAWSVLADAWSAAVEAWSAIAERSSATADASPVVAEPSSAGVEVRSIADEAPSAAEEAGPAAPEAGRAARETAPAADAHPPAVTMALARQGQWGVRGALTHGAGAVARGAGDEKTRYPIASPRLAKEPLGNDPLPCDI